MIDKIELAKRYAKLYKEFAETWTETGKFMVTDEMKGYCRGKAEAYNDAVKRFEEIVEDYERSVKLCKTMERIK